MRRRDADVYEYFKERRMASANEAVGIPVTSVKSIGFNIFVMPVFRALNTEKILALTEKLFHSKCDQRYFKER